MICPHCNAAVDKDAKQCPFCMKDITAPQPQFHKNLQQWIDSETEPIASDQNKAPQNKSSKKWVVPTIIGTVACAGIAAAVAFLPKHNNTKQPDSSSEISSVISADSSSAAETSVTTKTTPASSTATTETTAASTRKKIERQTLDESYLPSGLYLGMSRPAADSIMVNAFHPLNKEPSVRHSTSGNEIYKYFFSEVPEKIGLFKDALHNQQFSCELFFNENGELVQFEIWTNVAYKAEDNSGSYGGDPAKAAEAFEKMCSGLEGFADTAIETGNEDDIIYKSDEKERGIQIKKTNTGDDQYCAYYSYWKTN